MPVEAAAAMKERLLMVRINGIEVSESDAVLELEPGRLFLPAGVFRRGRLPLPAQRPTQRFRVGPGLLPAGCYRGSAVRD